MVNRSTDLKQGNRSSIMSIAYTGKDAQPRVVVGDTEGDIGTGTAEARLCWFFNLRLPLCPISVQIEDHE